MKKVFLLLVFAFCATGAFASKTDPTNSTVGKSDFSNPNDILLHSLDANCILCTACYTSQNYICASGSNCEDAAEKLAFAFEAMNCAGSTGG